MTTPKITIITPSFNQADYLEATIKSVLDQKYPNLEYIIADNASTDGSVEIIRRYAKKYPKIIRWQSKPDKGQSNAINQCLKKATGDIVAYINSDDYYFPDTFKTVVSYFNSHPERLWLVGDCQVSDPKLTWTFALKHLWPIQLHPFFLQVFNTVNQPSVFLTKELVKKVGLFDESLNYVFDYDYWLRALRFSLPGRIDHQFSFFRIHQQSKGNKGFYKQFQEDFSVAKKHTKNPLALLLHYLGWQTTIFCYKLLKK